MSVHPDKSMLRQFIEGKLSANDASSVKSHIENCEFCAEFCQDYKSLVESIDLAWTEDIPESARTLANRIQPIPKPGSFIDLKRLFESAADVLSAIKPVPEFALAADGSKGEEIVLPRCLATYYSEEPDIILRVMSYPQKEGRYLQLASDDPRTVSNVILELPDSGREFLTDSDGCAILQADLVGDYDKLNWRVKLPEAEFQLSPLIYDPNATKYASETTLETERQDKIRVKFEGKTEGKLITIEVLQLEGTSEFGPVKVVVSYEGLAEAQNAQAGQEVSFGIADTKRPIKVRIFR